NDDAASDAGSEAVSETSTLEHDQEPYSTFSQKVLLLLMELFPGHDTKCFKLERMKGGSYNRIIGVTVRPPEKKKTRFRKIRDVFFRCAGYRPKQKANAGDQYILRIPRLFFDGVDNEMVYHAATLAFLAKRCPYAVPKILVHDKTGNNALGTAYMLQYRLPGQSLFNLWDELNFEQQKSAVRQLSQILLDLHKITSHFGGIVGKMNSVYDFDTFLQVETFPIPDLSAPTNDNPILRTACSKLQTTRDFLIDLCKRRKQEEEYNCGVGESWPVWDDFTRIINKLDKLGFFNDHRGFHLCHLDFQIRNLLAEVVDNSTIKITGILDWDSALLGPKFLSYRAPFFLWCDDDSQDSDEEQVLHVPENEEDRELKKIFEDTVGPEFLRYATAPEYIILRRMFWKMRSGISSDWELTAAQDIVADFNKLYPMD
ncbi:hypothetical protein P154DRAFT_414104, partial [Amniculicola lignicola CBS 123094]